jgi:acetyl esterase/lipase
MNRTFTCIVALLLALPPALSAQEKAKKGPPVKLTAVEIKSDTKLYRKTPQGELFMHLYYPPGWTEKDSRPGIVFFFGGGWKNGAYTQFVPQAEYFASRGLVCACADYRIESKHKTTPDACVEDAKAAVRWLRANSASLGIDPAKLIASGGSAGGHLAAATALCEGFDAKDDDLKVSCKPNALVLFNPALNMSSAKVKDAAGNDIAKAFSPTLFLKKGAPPTILFFGTADKLIAHGDEYVAKSRELGNRVEMYTAPDMPHGFFNRSPWNEATARQADIFLTSLGYLKGEPTIKLPAESKPLDVRK